MKSDAIKFIRKVVAENKFRQLVIDNVDKSFEGFQLSEEEKNSIITKNDYFKVLLAYANDTNNENNQEANPEVTIPPNVVMPQNYSPPNIRIVTPTPPPPPPHTSPSPTPTPHKSILNEKNAEIDKTVLEIRNNKGDNRYKNILNLVTLVAENT